MNTESNSRFSQWSLLAVFLVALGANFYFVTWNFTWGFMIGHEFRQAQTALIAYYIDLQNNFGIDYDSPLLGKPWQFPLELPIYQWAVVGIKRWLDLPDFEAARIVSISCFYLSLPAFFLLLGEVGLTWSRRLLVLTVILCCPVYLFYSRAFLIDPMAFMASVWFLTAFVLTMRRRRIHWALVCACAGIVAGLIKNVILLVWLLPAAIFGAWWLWRQLRAKAPPSELLKTLAWGIGPVIPPAIAIKWWVDYTDAIKAVHPSAYIFTSENLSKGNFGMFNLSSRFDPVMWRELMNCWSLAATSPWLIAAIITFGLVFCRAQWKRIAASFALFMAAQLLLPYAYALQDYYFYAATAFLAGAIGFVLLGLLDDVRWPLWVRLSLMAVPFGGLFGSYFQTGGYHAMQSAKSHGGSGLAFALRDYLPEEAVIVAAGMDWSAIIPYYSRHRALMIRNSLVNDYDYLGRAFTDLADEDVAVFLVAGDLRKDQRLIDFARERLNLYPTPTLQYLDIDAYFSRFYETAAWQRGLLSNYSGVVSGPDEGRESPSSQAEPVRLTERQSRLVMPMVKPLAKGFGIAYGFQTYDYNGELVIGAHSDSDIWMDLPSGAHRARWRFGINRAAIEQEELKTDGVGFVAWIENQSGERREVFRRDLRPVEIEADRGMHTGEFEVNLAEEETLVFGTRSIGNYIFDWGMIASITVD